MLGGEFQLGQTLKRGLEEKFYHVFTNVLLSADAGNLQIDHIVVSRYGIFVMETIHGKGVIEGNEATAQWIRQTGKTESFPNPLVQNQKHIEALQSLLDFPAEMFVSLVVFAGNVTFKTPMPASVITSVQCVDTIKSRERILMSDIQVEKMVLAIEYERIQSGQMTNKKHKAHIESAIAAKNSRSRIANSVELLQLGIGADKSRWKIGKTLFRAVILLALLYFSVDYLPEQYRDVARQYRDKAVAMTTGASEKLAENDGSFFTSAKNKLLETFQSESSKQEQEEQRQKEEQALVNSAKNNEFNNQNVAYLKKIDNRDMDDAFDRQYTPAEECEQPSDRLFAQCANDRMRAKREFAKTWEQRQSKKQP